METELFYELFFYDWVIIKMSLPLWVEAKRTFRLVLSKLHPVPSIAPCRSIPVSMSCRYPSRNPARIILLGLLIGLDQYGLIIRRQHLCMSITKILPGYVMFCVYDIVFVSTYFVLSIFVDKDFHFNLSFTIVGDMLHTNNLYLLLVFALVELFHQFPAVDAASVTMYLVLPFYGTNVQNFI